MRKTRIRRRRRRGEAREQLWGPREHRQLGGVQGVWDGPIVLIGPEREGAGTQRFLSGNKSSGPEESCASGGALGRR